MGMVDSVRRWVERPRVARVLRTAGRAVAPLLSLGILAAALVELRLLDWHAVAAMVPRDPRFWPMFALAYATPVLCDWAIYRRLWGVPASGIAALAGKMIGNDLLIGYAGEAYLIAWARARGQPVRAALAAVKDVSILSAVVGNGATLFLTIAALPFLGALQLGVPGWIVAASVAVIAAPPLLALILRRRLFGLPAASLRTVAAIHAVRATATVSLTALLWHLAMPQVAVFWWLVLSALKLVVSRLPLVSNKDLVFAGVTVALLGHQAGVPLMLSMIATLTLATHVAVGAVLGIAGMADAAMRRGRVAAPVG